MLDACAELVDEVGYEGLTTTLLADRANVAIGSVYQFFPDKRAIVQALALRNMEGYLERLSDRFSRGDLDQWWDGVDAGIGEYIDMHRTVPGFRTLHFGDVVDVHLLDEERDNNGVIAEQLARVLVEQFSITDTPSLRFALEIAVEAADALIKLAFRRDPEGDDRVLVEAKALIREYLHRQVDTEPTAAAGEATAEPSPEADPEGGAATAPAARREPDPEGAATSPAESGSAAGG